MRSIASFILKKISTCLTLNGSSLGKAFCFGLAFLSLPLAHAQYFDDNGRQLTGAETYFWNADEILNKTNLKIVKTSSENPFEWAGALSSFDYDCTGGVFALPGYKQTDKALVLTAGHCVQVLKGRVLQPKEVYINHSLDPNSLFFLFPRDRKFWSVDPITNQKTLVSSSKIELRRVIFASFDYVDFAVLEMSQTYADLVYPEGQSPPLLSLASPKIGERVKAFGIPHGSLYESVFFHQAECNITNKESSYAIYRNLGVDSNSKYISIDSNNFSCTVFKGMSGGYVRDLMGRVVGVNSGYTLGVSNFKPTEPLAKCADTNGQFDHDCLLKLKNQIESWN